MSQTKPCFLCQEARDEGDLRYDSVANVYLCEYCWELWNEDPDQPEAHDDSRDPH